MKEANDLLVDAMHCNLTHEVLVLPNRIETKYEEVKDLLGSSVIELILIKITLPCS